MSLAMKGKCLLRTAGIGLVTLLACQISCAQILIGQTAGYSGPAAPSIKERMAGANLYFDTINAQGGVNGQKIEVISLDDKSDPKLSAETSRKLIVERKVIALFLSSGTPHTQAVIPLLHEFKVPLVAPATGAMAMHKPVDPYIFNVRAPYQREAELAIHHLKGVSFDRIAILYVDDSFGSDALVGVTSGFAALKMKPVVQEKFDRIKPDFSALASTIFKAQAQAVMIIGASAAVTDGTKAIRATGSKAQIVTLSNNASSGFIKQMGENAHGTIVTQVFPSERAMKTAMVREAVAIAKTKGVQTVSPSVLEGYAAAKVLTEALRRAGSNPTREKLLSALNTLNKFDLGGMELSFSPTDHSGLDYAEMSIISLDGKFRR